MSHRLLALLGAALLLVGCAVRPPEGSAGPATASRPAIHVGSDGTARGDVLAELYVQAVVARGTSATATRASASLTTVLPGLAAGDPAVVPEFARTALEQLSTEEVPVDADGLVAELARAVDQAAVVLRPAAVAGEPAYLSSTDLAATLAGSLAGLSRLKRTVRIGLPSTLADSADGPAGLRAAYHLRLAVRVIDDPVARYRALHEGALEVAAFLPTETLPTGADVRALADPAGLVQPDPLIALISPEFADDRAVLGPLQDLHDVLTSADVARISAAASTRGVPAAVAEWLAEHGSGG